MAADYLKEETVLHGRYEIKKVLGIGGFGITYLANDRSLSQCVVVKEYFPMEITGRKEDGRGLELPREKNDRKHFLKGRKDFLTEARRMSKLFDVPEVVKVLDWFGENETAYLVMEYVKGISLDRHLQRQDVPFTFRQAWEMLEPVAAAMEKVHKRGMIHRDLNPGNLMLQEDGTLKIIDFGAARPYLETEKTLTVLIKKGYAPPEQYMRKGGQGPWTDVYALCATIYEMITGVRPEPSINRIQKDELYLPSAYGAEILPEEEQILCRGLELDVKKRFADMKKLRQALLPPREEKGEKERKRFIKMLGIGLIAALGLLGAAAFFWFQDIKEEETVSYAGNYGRQTAEYEEYIEFVKENAISAEKGEKDPVYPYEGTSTIYTLPPEAVAKWGEPCNRLRFERTKDEFLDYMEREGYPLEKTKEMRENTVEVKKYGAILTDFSRVELYETPAGQQVGIRSDSVNGELFTIEYVTTDANKEQVKEMMTVTARFLAGERFDTAEKVRKDFEKLEDRTQADGWHDTAYNYWLVVVGEENDASVSWRFGVNKEEFDYAEYFWE